MTDKITIQYADGAPEELSGEMTSDTHYPTIGLRQKTWINIEQGYSVRLEIRELDEEFLKIHSKS